MINFKWTWDGTEWVNQFGLAAGGIGCYTICMDCGYVLSSVQDVF